MGALPAACGPAVHVSSFLGRPVQTTKRPRFVADHTAGASALAYLSTCGSKVAAFIRLPQSIAPVGRNWLFFPSRTGHSSATNHRTYEVVHVGVDWQNPIIACVLLLLQTTVCYCKIHFPPLCSRFLVVLSARLTRPLAKIGPTT